MPITDSSQYALIMSEVLLCAGSLMNTETPNHTSLGAAIKRPGTGPSVDKGSGLHSL